VGIEVCVGGGTIVNSGVEVRLGEGLTSRSAQPAKAAAPKESAPLTRKSRRVNCFLSNVASCCRMSEVKAPR